MKVKMKVAIMRVNGDEQGRIMKRIKKKKRRRRKGKRRKRRRSNSSRMRRRTMSGIKRM